MGQNPGRPASGAWGAFLVRLSVLGASPLPPGKLAPRTAQDFWQPRKLPDSLSPSLSCRKGAQLCLSLKIQLRHWSGQPGGVGHPGWASSPQLSPPGCGHLETTPQHHCQDQDQPSQRAPTCVSRACTIRATAKGRPVLRRGMSRELRPTDTKVLGGPFVISYEARMGTESEGGELGLGHPSLGSYKCCMGPAPPMALLPLPPTPSFLPGCVPA